LKKPGVVGPEEREKREKVTSIKGGTQNDGLESTLQNGAIMDKKRRTTKIKLASPEVHL
jgi:hypothetical protein